MIGIQLTEPERRLLEHVVSVYLFGDEPDGPGDLTQREATVRQLFQKIQDAMPEPAS
jgi:hypothetical protein